MRRVWYADVADGGGCRFADKPLRTQQTDRCTQPKGWQYCGGPYSGVGGQIGRERRRRRVHERVEEARCAYKQHADQRCAQRCVDGSCTHEAADKSHLLLVESGTAERGQSIGADEACGLFSETDDQQY